MTLHVALVGTDGIVLAGDKQIITREDDGYATTSLSSKIKLDRNKRIAVAWARDDMAEVIADELIKNPLVAADESRLREFIEETYRAKWGTSNMGKRAELLIVSPTLPEKLFYAEVNAQGCCKARQVEDKMYAGHTQSAALYLTERYYEKTSVAGLIPLAAHTILSAGYLHSMIVKGLDIIKCSENELTRVPDSTIALLKQKEEKTDRELRRLLYPCD